LSAQQSRKLLTHQISETVSIDLRKERDLENANGVKTESALISGYIITLVQ